MNESDVTSILQESVITAVAQSIRPTLSVKYLNVSFTKPSDGVWLELIHIPNPPPDQQWGNEKIFRGIFRMLLHWPNDGGGTSRAMKLADSIMSKYNKHNVLGGNLRLLNQPRLSSFLEEETEIILPITFEYISFSS